MEHFLFLIKIIKNVMTCAPKLLKYENISAKEIQHISN